jgi:RNA 2',3'-cyclic 3'-phosphodiesterase
LSSEPTRRLFFALWPGEDERAALLDAVRELVGASGGRPVPPANLHVTLAFLGAVPAARVPDLSAIASRVAAAFPRDSLPLVLTLQDVAHWAHSQVLAIPAREEPGLAPGAQALARMLCHEAAGAGFDPDLKPFRAHVTVARKVARALHASAMRPVAWSFAAFALIESRTLASGAAYSVVESFVLGSGEKVRTQK